MIRTSPWPLDTAPATQVLIRIACRVVEREYRLRPKADWQHPPTRILQLAEHYRRHFPGLALYSPLVYVAKAVESGVRLRDVSLMRPEQIDRALHKRRVGLARW